MRSTMHMAGKRSQQKILAIYSLPKESRCLFIRDRTITISFLVDTGSDGSLISANVYQKRNTSKQPLFAANSSTINVYGEKRLNLNLKRYFIWTFRIADVSSPILGADFLYYFGLVPNLKNNRFVTGSSPVPLKTHRVGQRCTLNLSRAETSSRWCGVVFLEGHTNPKKSHAGVRKSFEPLKWNENAEQAFLVAKNAMAEATLNTVFGYVVSGSVDVEKDSNIHCGLIRDSDLNTTLRSFWELESIGVKNENCNSEEGVSFKMYSLLKHLDPPAKSGFGPSSWILQRVGTWQQSGFWDPLEPWSSPKCYYAIGYAPAFPIDQGC
ncbi:peptidase A2 domain-containing protein [Trichonephila clavipes]|nr:peptidase A2 domain-containing protein [Trichonephila clavipes]